MIYYVLMLELPGVTPEDIDNFTFDQIEVFLREIKNFRAEIPRTDVALYSIFKGLTRGEKDKSTRLPQTAPAPQVARVAQTASSQSRLIPRYQVTKKEMDAFYQAGMPSPFSKWLSSYRKSHVR